jgi:transposase
MRPKLKITGPGTHDQVRDAFKKETDPKRRRKLQAIRLGFMGEHTTEEIAEIVGSAKSSVTLWVKAYRAGGIGQLLKTNHKPGRQPSLDDKAVAELLEGLEAGRWKRIKEIRKWLADEHGVGLSYRGVHYWLEKLGASLKVPRKSHAKKDEGQSILFKEGLARKLAELGVDTQKPFRLWVVDEHRYGLISTLRRCWTLRGVRPSAPYQTKYQWGYVYGGLEVMEGRSEFLYTPAVSLQLSGEFLRQIAHSEPDAEHVVVWDGAGFHQKEQLEGLPGNIHLIALPPYSPELNPIEQLWDQVAVAYANRVYGTLDEIEEDITDALRPFWTSPQPVLRLLGADNYLLRSANDS